MTVQRSIAESSKATPYVNVSQLKNFAKFVKKRFALNLSMAQHAACRASGYSGFEEIYCFVEEGRVLDRVGPSELPLWQRRLGFELGSDLEVLMHDAELEMWFRRIHGVAAHGLGDEGQTLSQMLAT